MWSECRGLISDDLRPKHMLDIGFTLEQIIDSMKMEYTMISLLPWSYHFLVFIRIVGFLVHCRDGELVMISIFWWSFCKSSLLFCLHILSQRPRSRLPASAWKKGKKCYFCRHYDMDRIATRISHIYSGLDATWARCNKIIGAIPHKAKGMHLKLWGLWK